MRVLIIIAFLLSIQNLVTAQDSIILRNKIIILARVVEIGDANIVYKKEENPLGPDYKISVNSVKRIVFSNGTMEEFSRRIPQPPARLARMAAEPSRRVQTIVKNKKLYPPTLPHNLWSVGWFMAQTVYNNSPDEKLNPGLFVKYERLILNEVVGVGVTPFVGLGSKLLGAKLNLMAYTKFFGKLRIGVGSYYSISKQKFTRAYWVDNYTSNSPARFYPYYNYVFVNDDRATLGCVGLSSVAMLHLTPKYLLSFGADVGGVVHKNNYKGFPSNWHKVRSGEATTLGQFSLGITHRF